MAMKRRLLSLIACLCVPYGANAMEIDFEGSLVAEHRHFLHEGKSSQHEQDFTSLSSTIELGFYSLSGRHAVIVQPFARYDQHDHERTHADLREAKYRYTNGGWEVTIGVDKVFLGVTEFLHLVDIINQTDNVESIDGEQKLGQPMVRLSYSGTYGTFTAFSLPYFRIRRFPDAQTGRPNNGFVIDTATTLFEETGGHERVVDDYALRYSHNIGVIDFGLSWFDGTSRDPEIITTPTGVYNNQPVFRARYNLLQQAGLDVQATLSSWLLKLEATHSEIGGQTFGRATGGFEYSFYNLFNSGTDLGLVVEYLWDERGLQAPHPFGDDLGVGLRWTANDTQSTAILLGGLIDTKTNTTALSLEAERRVGQNFKVILEARLQDKIGAKDLIFGPANRKEDMLRLQFAWYF